MWAYSRGEKLHILVVNLNNLKYTVDCLNDLLIQSSRDFRLTVVDQNSNEVGTMETLKPLCEKFNNCYLHKNKNNTPLNHVWNDFNLFCRDDQYKCFLNNDVRLSEHFVRDTIEVLDKEPNVAIVCHSTNHPNYKVTKNSLEYTIVEPNKNMQGWDFTIRGHLFKTIPNFLRTYCGDDFIFQKVYDEGYDIAYVTSSPIIHYEGKSKKYLKENGVLDIQKYIQSGHKHHLKINFNFSKIKPTFNIIENENISNQ